MKHMKKLFAIALVVMMIAALAVPALAAGGTISITEPKNDSYAAYKIFDVSGTADALTYKLPAGSDWTNVLLDDSTTPATSLITGLEFTKNTDGSYTVVKLASFSAADFADKLKGAVATVSATPELFDTTTDKLAVTENGYYLVVSTPGAAFDKANLSSKAALTTVLDGNVDVQNKNSMIFEKEEQVNSGAWVTEDDVQVGDTVNYKIDSEVPGDIPASGSYTFIVKDTMDAGLTFGGSVTVKVGGTEVALTEITNPSTPIVSGNVVRYNTDGFELSLDLVGKTAGTAIEITYSATVNEDAVATVSVNTAHLVYGDHPALDSEARVYSSELVIDKYETGEPSQKLAGAEFVLYKVVNEAGTDITYYYNVDASGVVSWVKAADLKDSSNAAVTDPAEAANITKVTTDTAGKASFKGLTDGDYFLLETVAPTGYVKLTNPIAVTIDGSASLTSGLSDDQIKTALSPVSHIANTPGSSLPSTGGIGTTIFYVVGSILVVGAGVVLITRKRMTKEN